MKRYLLDTNICVFYLKGQYDIPRQIAAIGRRRCAISEITVLELLYGAACSNRVVDATEEVNALVDALEVIPIGEARLLFAQAKALLRAKGEMIDDFDLLIGTTAVAHDCVMVTENLRHLARIPGISIENWVKR